MIDRATARVRLQVAFGDVGASVLPIDQNVIPGAVFWRLRPGLGVVPVVGPVKSWIDVDDNAAVFEQPMMHQLANRKFRFTAQFVAFSRLARPSSEHILSVHYML